MSYGGSTDRCADSFATSLWRISHSSSPLIWFEPAADCGVKVYLGVLLHRLALQSPFLLLLLLLLRRWPLQRRCGLPVTHGESNSFNDKSPFELSFIPFSVPSLLFFVAAAAYCHRRS